MEYTLEIDIEWPDDAGGVVDREIDVEFTEDKTLGDNGKTYSEFCFSQFRCDDKQLEAYAMILYNEQGAFQRRVDEAIQQHGEEWVQ